MQYKERVEDEDCEASKRSEEFLCVDSVSSEQLELYLRSCQLVRSGWQAYTVSAVSKVLSFTMHHAVGVTTFLLGAVPSPAIDWGVWASSQQGSEGVTTVKQILFLGVQSQELTLVC